MSLIDIIIAPFGFIMKLCCFISFNNYVIALFFFALVFQAILFPLGIKQQKSSIKMAAIRPKEMAIRKKYAGRDDAPTKQKLNTELQELYSREGYNPLSGCLPLLIQLPIIFILFAVVRNPLSYSVEIGNAEKVDGYYHEAIIMLDEAKQSVYDFFGYYESAEDSAEKTEAKAKADAVLSKEISQSYKAGASNGSINGIIESSFKAKTSYDKDGHLIVEYTSDGKDTYAEYILIGIIQDGKETLEGFLADNGIDYALENDFSDEVKDSIPNFSLFGISTLDTPKVEFDWLLLIPILVFLSSYFGAYVTRKLTPQQTDANGKTVGGGLMMTVGMPALSAVFAFQFTAAIGVYWIWRSLLGMVQQYILSKMYPIPTFTKEELAAAERELKKAAVKKKKVIMIEVDEDDETYKDIEVKGASEKYQSKYKMLSKDDDDDTPSASGEETSDTGKKPLIEKQKPKD